MGTAAAPWDGVASAQSHVKALTPLLWRSELTKMWPELAGMLPDSFFPRHQLLGAGSAGAAKLAPQREW